MQAVESSTSCEPDRQSGEQAGGRRSCSGQTRSIIDETQATEEEDAAQTRFRSGELIVFFSVLLLSHTTET